VTDRSSPSDAPGPEQVRRSLRALADGSAPPRGPNGGTTASAVTSIVPKSTVDDAERAVQYACEAASFLSADRLPELDRAIATAARRGDDGLAARGRRARKSLRRLDAAVDGTETTEASIGDDTTTSTPVAERF